MICCFTSAIAECRHLVRRFCGNPKSNSDGGRISSVRGVNCVVVVFFGSVNFVVTVVVGGGGAGLANNIILFYFVFKVCCIPVISKIQILPVAALYNNQATEQCLTDSCALALGVELEQDSSVADYNLCRCWFQTKAF